jgi:hypothetical protein
LGARHRLSEVPCIPSLQDLKMTMRDWPDAGDEGAVALEVGETNSVQQSSAKFLHQCLQTGFVDREGQLDSGQLLQSAGAVLVISSPEIVSQSKWRSVNRSEDSIRETVA